MAELSDILTGDDAMMCWLLNMLPQGATTRKLCVLDYEGDLEVVRCCGADCPGDYGNGNHYDNDRCYHHDGYFTKIYMFGVNVDFKHYHITRYATVTDYYIVLSINYTNGQEYYLPSDVMCEVPIPRALPTPMWLEYDEYDDIHTMHRAVHELSQFLPEELVILCIMHLVKIHDGNGDEDGEDGEDGNGYEGGYFYGVGYESDGSEAAREADREYAREYAREHRVERRM